MFIDREGNVFNGVQTPDSFYVNNPTSKYSKLKANWDSVIPDVWEYDVTSHKSNLLSELNKKFNDKINTILNYYPENEVKSWPQKAEQAKKWLSLSEIQKDAQKDLDDFAILRTEACGAETTNIAYMDTLATRVNNNRIAYETFCGKVMNKKSVYKSNIDNSTTEEQLNLILINFDDITIGA